MADTKIITEKDEDEEVLVPVETLPEAKKEPEADDKADAKADDAEEDDHDEEDEGDARLAENAEEKNEEVISANRKRRQKRKELQTKAREKTEYELRMLREQNAELMRRVGSVETHAVHQNLSAIEGRLQEAVNDARMAEDILGKAIEAGNGADAAAALRLRDEAQGRAFQLNQAKQQLTQRQQAPRGADLVVQNLAREWLSANPWYDPKGSDEDSRITKAIDDGLTGEGYNPKSQEYWHELTRRVSARLAPADGAQRKGPDTGRRTPPPQGNGREHAPQSTRNEIYVTPERKQAMIDAGSWDDPAKRNKMLKAYRDYDKNSAN
jgi:hypothetical protein